MIEQFCSIEYNQFHVPHLSDKTPEAVFHGQPAKTVACLRVSTAQQDARRQRQAILDALAKARVSARKLGRPKGSLGVSRLNGKEDAIRRFLERGLSKTALAKLTGVSRTTLYSLMRTRGLKPSP